MSLDKFKQHEISTGLDSKIKGGITEAEFWDVYDHLIGTGNANDARQASIIVNMYAAGNIQFE